MVAQDAMKSTFYFLKLQNFPGEVPLTSPSLMRGVCRLLKIFLPLLQIFGRTLGYLLESLISGLYGTYVSWNMQAIWGIPDSLHKTWLA